MFMQIVISPLDPSDSGAGKEQVAIRKPSIKKQTGFMLEAAQKEEVKVAQVINKPLLTYQRRSCKPTGVATAYVWRGAQW